MDTTTNRSVYNKSRKYYLDNVGEIRCTFCPYHKKENSTSNLYWVYKRGKYPSWKLVSKNKKQWMGKPIKFVTKSFRRTDMGEYIEIIF